MATSSDVDTIIDRLKRVLATNLARTRAAEEIGDDEPLMGGGLNLDSIGIVELVELVETEFKFQFDDADLRTATFESVRTLAGAIAGRLDSVGAVRPSPAG
jgi:acyl carrier protein